MKVQRTNKAIESKEAKRKLDLNKIPIQNSYSFIFRAYRQFEFTALIASLRQFIGINKDRGL